ncbi:MAG: hypothetical protein GY847_15175 [Proteobacteria bacterium]|nr:hypothetical protein [Pseudomonadota bacterium]
MDTAKLFDVSQRGKILVALAVCIAILVGASLIASLVQTDFGRTEVTNVAFRNEFGILVRAKLFRPTSATQDNPMPGVVFIHGYQSTRETGDPFCIELARRGFVSLCIDAIGRGNSGLPGDDPSAYHFDETFGGRAAVKQLKSYPFVRSASVGMVGHSLGAEMAYKVAIEDPTVEGLVIIGFAYTLDATPQKPKNMLMIIGSLDEFRDRMTGTRDIEAEWMSTEQTKNAIPIDNPKIGVTYGDFNNGTARRVIVPGVIHIQETHSRVAVAETLEWMKTALDPAEQYWVDSNNQIWALKEWATLLAMLACFASILPLGLVLLRLETFKSIRGPAPGVYACSSKEYLRFVGINGLLMWLYLPAAIVVFGIHRYVIRIDRIFPMMIANVTIWWFVLINVIGFFLFLRWIKRRTRDDGLTLKDLGISFRNDIFSLDSLQMGKTVLLASLIFGFAYSVEHLLEAIFIVDFRFVFAFASDLTAYRVLMFLLYLPFFIVGFTQLGFFLHGQLVRPKKETWLKTFAYWSLSNTSALIVPLVLLMLVQYIPLLTTGAIPLVGPGGMFVLLIINLFHIVGVLLMIIPISTWFYQLTGRPYLGALLCAALVAWMFTSSQVIAPVPIK